MADFGVIELSIDGETVAIKGNVTFNNLNLSEKTFEANMDGTMHSSSAPMVATAEIEGVSACALPIEEIVRIVNRCIDEDQGVSAIFGLGGTCTANFKTINFVDAEVGGTVNLDGATGEVSGIVLAADNVLINGVSVRGQVNAGA